MNENINKLHEIMKQEIDSKTKCMIESYYSVLKNTKEMINAADLEVADDEVLKRSDMFWTIAMQRIDKEQDLATRGGRMPTQQQPYPGQPQGESPCAKKSREAAEKIAVLEAEVISKKEKK